MSEQSVCRWREISATMLIVMLVAVAVTACGSSTSSSGNGSGSGGSGGSTQGFELKIGEIMPFTGDLSSFGPSLAAAAKLGAQTVNAALAEDHLSSKFSVKVVDTEDDQSATAPAVEAAQKMAGDNVNVIVGTLESGSTIAVAQSVSIPDKIVQITPTSDSTAITNLQDNNLVFQMFAPVTFQSRAIAQYAGQTLGKHALINVGWRNAEDEHELASLLIEAWKQQGGRVGVTESWDPDAPSYGSAAQRLVAGNPDGWVIFEDAQPWQKVGPALVRTGNWSPSKTFGDAALADASALAPIGTQATAGLRGVEPNFGGSTLQTTFADYFKKMEPGKAVTGYESFAFDAVVLSSLAALAAHSPSGPTFSKDIEAISNSPGTQYDYQHLAAAIDAIEAGQKIQYDAVSSRLDLSPQGAPTVARYNFWQFENHAIKVLSSATVR